MKIGDEVYIHGYVDEIRKDTVIIRNEGGYFGTIPSEINRQETVTEFADRCRECGARYGRLLRQTSKTGHWIHTKECDEEWQYRCSKCNMPSRSNAHRYCSNCGSYMYSTKMESEDMITHIEAVQDNLNRMVDGLDDDTDYYDATYHLEQIKEKVEQEPCEDCVSREQAKTEIRKAFPSLADRVDINSILNELPSVQPKTGHWIEDFKNSVMCSCCKQQFHWEDYDYDRKEWITTHDRCPFCGAKMESEGEE